MACRILVLHAHPAPHKSRVNRALLAAAESVDGVTVRSLYELYLDLVRERIAALEDLFSNDPLDSSNNDGKAWDPPYQKPDGKT